MYNGRYQGSNQASKIGRSFVLFAGIFFCRQYALIVSYVRSLLPDLQSGSFVVLGDYFNLSFDPCLSKEVILSDMLVLIFH